MSHVDDLYEPNDREPSEPDPEPSITIEAATIADHLTGSDNDYTEALNGWPSLHAEGNVLHIKFTPAKETATGGEADKDGVRYFEAHVFEVPPAPPVAAEPVTLPVATARELTYCDLDDDPIDGWTVVHNAEFDHARWESIHQLVIRNEQGEHFSDTYRRGLTESQGTQPYEYETEAVFKPVTRKTTVVQTVGWITPKTQPA